MNDKQSSRRPPQAKKSLGQNFLVDKRYVSRILQAAELSSGDVIIEVGPGRGVLTRELSKIAARVVAVELDDALAADLTSEFFDNATVEIINADAREVAVDTLVTDDTPYKVVANLPYYAALPIMRRFLEAEHKPHLMVVMVQREVAQNMTASPDDMTMVSVAVQLYGKPKIVSSVPPRAFRPAPKVTSAIVRIEVYPEPAIEIESDEHFFTLVRAGFSAPRKQIHNCLRNGLTISSEAAHSMLLDAGIDSRRRAETLSLAEWGSLYERFRLNYPHDDQSSAEADSKSLRQG